MASPRHSAHPGRWLSFYVGAGLLAFIAVTLGPSLVGHNTLLAVDRITTHYPFLVHGSNLNGHMLCATDTIDSQIPETQYVRTQLAAGHLPNWQGLVAGGSPLASQPNLGLLTPISWPYFLMPLWLAPAFIKLLEIIVAVVGMWLFLRRFGVRPAGSMLAGFTFAVSGFMVMWTNWPQAEVAAYIPLLFWATERLIQRARLTDSIPIALVVAAMLLGGFPAVTGWAMYAAVIYLVVRLWVRHRHERRQAWNRVGIGALGVFLGLLLSMVQLLPFAATYTSSDMSYRSGLGLSPLPLSGLMTLFVPDANGLCLGGTQTYGSWSPIELVAYVGSAAMVLAVVGAVANLRRVDSDGRSVRGYFTIAAAFVLFVGWGTTLVLEIIDHLPVFSGNPIGRIRALLGFFLAVLVGFGFDALQRRYRRRRELAAEAKPSRSLSRRVLLWQLVVVGGALGLAAGVAWYAQENAKAGGFRHALLTHSKAPILLIAIAVFCVVIAYLRWRPTTMLALVALPVLVFVQGAAFFHTVLPGDSKANFFPVTPAHEFLKQNIGAQRFASADGALYPETAPYYGLRSATGHTFHEPEWADLVNMISAMVSPTHSDFSDIVTPDVAGDSKILDRMAVKYFVVGPATLTGEFVPLPTASGTLTAVAGQPACTLPGGPLRGVTVELGQTIYAADPAKGITLNLSLSSGGKTVNAARYLGTGIPAGVPITVAAAGEDLPAGQPVNVSASVSGGAAPLVLATQPTGGAVCAPVLPTHDGLKVVYSDAGTIIYQRLTAMPRIRWATASTVITGRYARIDALAIGVPPDTVVLDQPGPAPSGKSAKVSVVDDSGGHISADVDAAGAGYLVIADALQQPGWSVSIDGHAAKLVAADHAMGAVAVPAGVHRVTFEYHAPGQVAGAALSGVAVVLMIGIGILQRRRRSPAEGNPDDELSVEEPEQPSPSARP